MKINELEDIKKDYKILSAIEWDMTPEEAIALHLEWGPLRDQSYYNSRDNDNETVYFIINTWGSYPEVSLIKRIGFDSEEITRFKLPIQFKEKFMEEIGKFKGVYAPNEEIKSWLKKQLEVL